MASEFHEWTDRFFDDDPFWEELELIKSQAKIDGGWLYVENILWQNLYWLVGRHDPINKKNILKYTEVIMKHLLKDQYIKKTHKKAVISPGKKKPKRKQKYTPHDSRRSSRIIFISS